MGDVYVHMIWLVTYLKQSHLYDRCLFLFLPGLCKLLFIFSILWAEGRKGSEEAKSAEDKNVDRNAEGNNTDGDTDGVPEDQGSSDEDVDMVEAEVAEAEVAEAEQDKGDEDADGGDVSDDSDEDSEQSTGEEVIAILNNYVYAQMWPSSTNQPISRIVHVSGLYRKKPINNQYLEEKSELV